MLIEDGAVDLQVPRDRAGSFELQLVPRGQTRLDGFDDKFIPLYARGLRDLHVRALLGLGPLPMPSLPVAVRGKGGRLRGR